MPFAKQDKVIKHYIQQSSAHAPWHSLNSLIPKLGKGKQESENILERLCWKGKLFVLERRDLVEFY